MSIFHLDSCLDVLNQKLREYEGHKGYKSRLSEVMGIQRAHLSQILTGKLQLSPDHGAKLSDEWQFNELEADYFIHLIHYERAMTESLKARLSKRLKEIRTGLFNEGVHTIDQRDPSFAHAERFFSSWIFPAVAGTMRLEGMTDENSVAKRLELAPTVVRNVLLQLQEMKMADCVEGVWKMTGPGFAHASRSVQASMHAELRRKAHEVFVSGDTEVIRFSTVNVLTRAQFQELRARIKDFLRDFARDTVEVRPPNEEVTIFNVDFLRLGRPSLAEESPAPEPFEL